MESRAAIAVKAGAPLEVGTIDIEGPKAGECLVEIKATGVCHTDEFTLSGADPEGIFPAVLGHPECRVCDYCTSGKTNLCQQIRETQGQGLMPDNTSRFSRGNDKIFHYMGTSTFSNYTVVPEIALNTAQVKPGDNVVIFGLGGIGLNVIQGARLAGADIIVGVDLNPARKEMAEQFGMTHFVNPKEVEGDLVPYLVDLTKGGADYSFECIGNVDVMRQALECCHKGWGTSCLWWRKRSN